MPQSVGLPGAGQESGGGHGTTERFLGERGYEPLKGSPARVGASVDCSKPQAQLQLGSELNVARVHTLVTSR